VIANSFSKLLHVEARHRQSRRACVKTQIHNRVQAVTMEERQETDLRVFRAYDSHSSRLKYVCDYVVVREHDAFRQPRSAARIEERYKVFMNIYLRRGNVCCVRFQQ